MTSTLIVIALITHLKTYDKTVSGDALYRKKISSQNYTFGIKQFINARHEYNETFAEEIATIMEPKIDLNGKMIPWEPTNIPSSKPFINISTTVCKLMTLLEDMNFVKTQSSIYSSFHKNICTISFNIGYSKEAKWFEILNDKWNEPYPTPTTPLTFTTITSLSFTTLLTSTIPQNESNNKSINDDSNSTSTYTHPTRKHH
ncbi:hypothetical protein C1645_837591 [Glomus cerebriforme]|uniref:Uncharacterized protein n=1 Tax=Glomus cerebriforme TaxID=658196 RepID=A0A397S8C0_9GLOM|nr:hypothetical protein C1645_837591 [Glomus cerebriforme]